MVPAWKRVIKMRGAEKCILKVFLYEKVGVAAKYEYDSS
jgi:hypothetical protein